MNIQIQLYFPFRQDKAEWTDVPMTQVCVREMLAPISTKSL
jgi:hypothetical protein